MCGNEAPGAYGVRKKYCLAIFLQHFQNCSVAKIGFPYCNLTKTLHGKSLKNHGFHTLSEVPAQFGMSMHSMIPLKKNKGFEAYSEIIPD